MVSVQVLLVIVAAVHLERTQACQPLLQPAHLGKQRSQKQAVPSNNAVLSSNAILSSDAEERISKIARLDEAENTSTTMTAPMTTTMTAPMTTTTTMTMPMTMTMTMTMASEKMCVERDNCTTNADCFGGVCRTDSSECSCSCDVGRQCASDDHCGPGGICGGDVPNLCVCACIHLRQCTTFAHCGGNQSNSCVPKCVDIDGVAQECNSKTTCIKGSQCMSGVCIGGGKMLENGHTVGVSCTVATAASDCAGIGTEKCSQEMGACILDMESSNIGKSTCSSEGVSATLGFPTCVSSDKQAIVCGDGLMCARGAHCGLCDCDL